MTKRITVEAALKSVGLDKKKLIQIEKDWSRKFGTELPIPRNELLHRQFTEPVLRWLDGLAKARAQGMDWIQARAELRAYEPQVKPRQARPSVSYDSFAEVY